LCKPDIAWQADPLRENAHDRARLFDLYQADLTARRLPYSEISGHGEERLARAISAVEEIAGG
jgi:nicotinamide riboside kinase